MALRRTPSGMITRKREFDRRTSRFSLDAPFRSHTQAGSVHRSLGIKLFKTIGFERLGRFLHVSFGRAYFPNPCGPACMPWATNSATGEGSTWGPRKPKAVRMRRMRHITGLTASNKCRCQLGSRTPPSRARLYEIVFRSTNEAPAQVRGCSTETCESF